MLGLGPACSALVALQVAQTPLTIGQVGEALGVHRQTAAHHLRILAGMGLVELLPGGGKSTAAGGRGASAAA